MKKVLITGIGGFVGSFLAEHLLSENNYSLFGTYLADPLPSYLSNLEKKITLIKVDLSDGQETEKLIEQVKPDLIFHLAAQASTGDSFKNPSKFISGNLIMQINILEPLKKNNLVNCRTLIVSSAEVYGLVSRDDLPINEETKHRPTSPYGVSKIGQDYLGLQYHLAYGLDNVRVRPFNHIGPRQTTHFVVADFAKKIAEIEKGKIDPILTVGNLSTKRDFTDVRDIVKGYCLLMEKGKSGEVYNIGSGVSYEISKILEILLSFSKTQIEVKVDKDLLRPADVPEVICDNSRIIKETGWKQEIPIEKSLKDTLDYWRNIV
ncbi:SDR family oxidoreductase [Candidatus Parcubacteria bacterium]|nr:MAG: SDR family oxidoreductase [Candidatus Parcubacteria bacterium]